MAPFSFPERGHDTKMRTETIEKQLMYAMLRNNGLRESLRGFLQTYYFNGRTLEEQAKLPVEDFTAMENTHVMAILQVLSESLLRSAEARELAPAQALEIELAVTTELKSAVERYKEKGTKNEN